MNLNFNFYYSKNIKINGDVRYQIDTISLLKKNGYNINLGKKNLEWIKSSIVKNISLLILRIPILSNLFNSTLNYLSRNLSYDFIDNHQRKGIDYLMRVKVSFSGVTKAFIASGRTCQIVEIYPEKDVDTSTKQYDKNTCKRLYTSYKRIVMKASETM